MTNPNDTMPNNFMIISDRLLRTKAPWRLNDSLFGSLSKDHWIVSIDTQKYDNFDFGQKIYKSISKILKNHTFEKKVFIGYRHDCDLLSSLWLQFNISFDAAIFIDNIHPAMVFESVPKQTTIYNLSSKREFPRIPFAVLNQHVKTHLPSHMSKRMAQEAFGILLYGVYNKNFLDDSNSKYLDLSKVD